MKIRGLRWQRYRLPFVARFSTAHGAMPAREGLILRIVSSDGTVGLGDAAPLAEFAGGTIDQTEATLRALIADLSGIDLDELGKLLEARLGDRAETAALRCGLETAELDLRARAQGVRVADLLAPAQVASSVAANATIGEPDPECAATLARDAVRRGFQTIKLKIGVAESHAGEVRRVAAVRDALGPDIALRLDANGAWEPETAIAILRRLAPFNIEYVEQPVAAHDIAGLARVRRAVPLPIAADEAVTNLPAVLRLIANRAADVLIIKPMVCGGLLAGRTIIERAGEAGLRVVVTSTIESGIGVAAALQLAATLPDGSPACGLATARLLRDDLLLEPLAITNGRMSLPPGPGLGVGLDETALARFGGGAEIP